MVETQAIFQDRKSEIEFYYSTLVAIENNKCKLATSDDPQMFRIMKSNFILMLYNFVEATFMTGMDEIYKKVEQEKCCYGNVINEIQNIWRDNRIKTVYKPESKLSTYTKQVKGIVNDITTNTPIVLTKSTLRINGNLDAKKIKETCDKHKIRYRASDSNDSLNKVKLKRNALAHGDDSFGNCSRDLTLLDLKGIMDAVFDFITGIVKGMELYYEKKQYLRSE